MKVIHWVPLITSKKMQKKLLDVIKLLNIVVNYQDAKKICWL